MEVDQKLEQPDVATQEQWQRSEEGGERARRFDPDERPLPGPGAEIEKILREYACECYAVGRGESMYYLVEDLPRLARAASMEILSLRANGGGGSDALAPKADSKAKTRAGYGKANVGGVGRLLKSAVAVLPLVAILAVLGVAIGMTFSEAIGALVGGTP